MCVLRGPSSLQRLQAACVEALLLGGEAYSGAGAPTQALPYVAAALGHSRRLSLEGLAAEAVVALAALWLDLGLLFSFPNFFIPFSSLFRSQICNLIFQSFLPWAPALPQIMSISGAACMLVSW